MDFSVFCLICVIVVMVGIVLRYAIKYRKIISWWWKRYNVKNFIVNVIMPSLIPLVITFLLPIFQNTNSETSKWSQYFKTTEFYFLFCMCVIAFVNFIFQFRVWKKEHEDKKTEWKNEIYRHAYHNLYDALKAKTDSYITAALDNKNGSLDEKHIRYDIFDHIREICGAFRCAVADMTDIPTTHINVSFIYHYTYEGANEKDKEWRWIMGKGTDFNMPLNEFIQREESLFHHLIFNNSSLVFFNNKEDAARECKYYYSAKDRLHDNKGSIFASKFAFSSNAQMCCEGIIVISTYGKTFIKEDSEHTPKDFEEMLDHDIFPCYKKMLKSELGMLYFRHRTEKIPNSFQKNIDKLVSIIKNK